MKKFKLIMLAFCLTLGLSGAVVYATDVSARLKDSLENDRIYSATDIETLNTFLKNKDIFKRQFDDKYVVVRGIINASSVSGNFKEVVINGAGGSITVDTSGDSAYATAQRLKIGDYFTVYGRIKVKGFRNDSFEIVADHGIINFEKEFSRGDEVCFKDSVIDSITITDLDKNGRVSVKVPASWTNPYVMDRLKNNNVDGYQFYLNALEPYGREFPEIFYMFYFDYETYLDSPPKSVDKWDRHEIEEHVAKNILESIDEKFRVNFDQMKTNNDDKLDYWSSSYNVDGKDYRLEFVVKPDNSKGLVVMLYLYYPRGEAVNHVQEAAYVVKNVSVP